MLKSEERQITKKVITKAEIKCKNADKYLAIWRPRCDCLHCRDKYIDTLEQKQKQK